MLAKLTHWVAAAREAAAAAPLSVVVVEAALAVGPIRVVSTVPAVATVPGGPVQLGVEVTSGALPVTVTGCGRMPTGSGLTLWRLQ